MKSPELLKALSDLDRNRITYSVWNIKIIFVKVANDLVIYVCACASVDFTVRLNLVMLAAT